MMAEHLKINHAIDKYVTLVNIDYIICSVVCTIAMRLAVVSLISVGFGRPLWQCHFYLLRSVRCFFDCKRIRIMFSRFFSLGGFFCFSRPIRVVDVVESAVFCFAPFAIWSCSYFATHMLTCSHSIVDNG